MDFDNMSEADMDAYLMANDPNMKQQPQDFGNMSEADMDAFLLANDPNMKQQGEDTVLNEQYAPIQGADRAMIKNTAGDKTGVMNYLHKEHPSSEFKYEGDSVLGRDRGTNEWRRMDVDSSVFSPSTWELQDITDVGSDIAGGIAEGAAGVAAAGIGSIATPVGSLAAGSAAAGATASAIEVMKQKAAQEMNLRAGEIDYGDAATTGITSALMTPLFGIGGGASKKFLGKTTKDALKKSTKEILKEQGSKDALLKITGAAPEQQGEAAIKALVEARARNMVAKGADFMEKGILSKAGTLTSTGAKKIGASFNEMSDDTISYYLKNDDIIDNATDETMDEFASIYSNQLAEGLDTMKDTLSGEFDKFKNVAGEVDIASLKTKADDVLDSIPKELKADVNVRREVQAYIDNLMLLSGDDNVTRLVMDGNKINQVTGPAKNYIQKMNVERALGFRQRLFDGTDSRQLSTVLEKAGYDAAASEVYIRDIAHEMADGLDDSLSKVIGKAYQPTREKYKQWADMKRGFSTFLHKDGATKHNHIADLMNSESRKSAVKRDKLAAITRLEEYLGLKDVGSEARNMITAYGKFGRKNLRYMPSSGTGITMARATAGGAGAAAASVLGVAGVAPVAAMALGGVGLASTRGIRATGKIGKGIGNALKGASKKMGKDTLGGNSWQRAATNALKNRDD